MAKKSKYEEVDLSPEAFEKIGINRYEAVILAAQEARVIHDMNRKEGIVPEMKPPTEALKNLLEGKIVKDTISRSIEEV